MRNKGHNRSEIRKYLDTLLADMGLEELGELSPDEQEAWEAAAMPRKDVAKKLKEMGYDLRGNRNKRSLGRTRKLLGIYKLAKQDDLKDDLMELKYLIGTSAYFAILPMITGFDDSEQVYSEEQYYKAIIQELNESGEDFSGKENKIEKTVANIAESLYNSKNKSEPAETAPRSGSTSGSLKLSDYFRMYQEPLTPRDLTGNNRLYILAFLGKLNYIDSWRASNEEIKEALSRFQKERKIPATGELDATTFSALVRESTSTRPAKRQKSPQGGAAETRGAAGRFDEKVDNIILGKNVDLSEVTPEVRKFVYIMDGIVAQLGLNNLYITSAFRSDYDQSRIMYGNYSSRGVGTPEARRYLEGLYRRFPNVSKIVDAYEAPGDREQRIRAGEKIINNTWPRVAHRAGQSLDLSGLSMSEIKTILDKMRSFADFKELNEGDHYHITIRSVYDQNMA
jgi:hypothetical protein